MDVLRGNHLPVTRVRQMGYLHPFILKNAIMTRFVSFKSGEQFRLQPKHCHQRQKSHNHQGLE